MINKAMKYASVFGIFSCMIAKIIKKLKVTVESPILYVARGQAQMVCNLYVKNVLDGGMDITRHTNLLNNTLHILSRFNLLGAEP